MPQVVIVGAGLTGLSIAFRLHRARPDVQITILEKTQRTGGNIGTERRNGFQIEWGPNGFLDSKPSTLQLCRDLGLENSLISASEDSRKNRYLFFKGKLRALPNSFWSFVKSDLLSWRGKLNLLFEKYRRRPQEILDDESVDAFARRRAGKEAAEIFADAMVTGIHGGDPTHLSINAAFPRVAHLEREFGSVTRGMSRTARMRRAEAAARGEAPPLPGRMWSFTNGLQVLVDSLRDQCGAIVIGGVNVRHVRRESPLPPQGSGWLVEADDNQSWRADAVVLASPAYEQAAQLESLDPQLSKQIGAIAYNRIAVVALGYRQSDVPVTRKGFGYIAPQSTRRDVLGVQWCSSIFPGRAPDGMILWRALCGGWQRREMVDWDDCRLIAAVQNELKLALQVQADPTFTHIVRWPNAIPQYTLGHLQRVAQIEESASQHPGLFLAGNAYHGVAMNDCTEQAEAVALVVARHLAC